MAVVLETDPQLGLSKAEARARLTRYGRNELLPEKPVPEWRRFLAQLQDALVVLLLVATAISAGLWVYERDTGLRARHLPSSRSSSSTPPEAQRLEVAA